jgi:hypothetical protein
MWASNWLRSAVIEAIETLRRRSLLERAGGGAKFALRWLSSTSPIGWWRELSRKSGVVNRLPSSNFRSSRRKRRTMLCFVRATRPRSHRGHQRVVSGGDYM